jgi:bifunctional DNA-binding transcriptional regulator/antitoxin component of YhaV-PrlF toxin-antitoxin module
VLIPGGVRKEVDIDVGSVLFMRTLGNAVVFLPLDFLRDKQILDSTDNQKDNMLALIANAAWRGRGVTAFDPPLVPITTPPVDPLENIPVDESATLQAVPAHITQVNKKGFIPIPQEIKDLLRLKMGDDVAVEVRKDERNEPLIVLRPVVDKKSLQTFLDRKRQSYEQQENQNAAMAQYKRNITLLREELKQVEDELIKNRQALKEAGVVDTRQRYIRGGVEALPPIDDERKMLIGPLTTTEPQTLMLFHHWVETRWGKVQVPAAHPPLPAAYLPEKGQKNITQKEPFVKEDIKEMPLAAGHKWVSSPFGRIQVPIAD